MQAHTHTRADPLERQSNRTSGSVDGNKYSSGGTLLSCWWSPFVHVSNCFTLPTSLSRRSFNPAQ